MKKELTAAFKERGIDFQFSEKKIGKEKTIELVLECSDEVIFQCVPLDEQNNVITSPKLKPHTLTDFEGNCISQLLDFLAVMMKNYFVDDEIDYSKLNIKEQRQKEILEHLDVISLDEENEKVIESKSKK